MKRTLWLSAALALLLSGGARGASSEWAVPLVGEMDLPPHVTFDKGEQNALPFMKDGGARRFFQHLGFSEGDYYTMTYREGPDFSYGWAAAHVAGIPFLWQAGLSKHTRAPLEDQMDAAAAYINDRVKGDRTFPYKGAAPLEKTADKKHPRWSGLFTATTYEKGIVYKEDYLVTLQITGSRVVLFVIESDGTRKDLTASLQKMVEKRHFWNEKELLRAYLAGK